MLSGSANITKRRGEEMIGKRVSQKELQEALEWQAGRDKFRAELEEELRTIKKGECFLYLAKPGSELLSELVFEGFIASIGKCLKKIAQGIKIYVYRE